MSASTTTVAPEVAVAPPGPRRTLWTLRVLAVLHSLSAIAQPMFAGIYLDGDVDALTVHEINSMVVAGLGVFQLVAAIVFVWAGRGRAWPLYAAIAIVLAEQVQTGLGYESQVAIHIPLGVSIIATQILLTVWLFRDGARVTRRRRAS